MLSTPDTPLVPPTTMLLSSVTAVQWIERTASGHVAFLLVTHPPMDCVDRSATVADQMRGLAGSIGLAPPSEQMPDVSACLDVLDDGAVAFRLASDLAWRVPTPNGEWHEFVRHGGPIALIVGLDCLAPTTARPIIDAYLVANAECDRLLLGKAQYQRPAPGESRQ